MTEVLLVDDDVRTCQSITFLLRSLGHDVSSVGSGRAALEYLACRQPGLLILDWMMPGLGGPDVLRELRRQPAGAGLAVVVYTALCDSATEGEARRLGATELVWKQGGWEALYPRLRKYLAAGQRGSRW